MYILGKDEMIAVGWSYAAQGMSEMQAVGQPTHLAARCPVARQLR